ncbi:MFS transporter [bacterium]|nr:MFS transporter [bacterium]
MHKTNYPPVTLAWTIWGLGAVLYLFGFFQRVAPGVMTSELSSDFSLNAASLGNLSAFYFYAYVAMQIPTGILSDILGPRRLLTAGALISGLGTVIFAFAGNAGLAGIGRLLIGGSVAVAYVGMLKLAQHWFEPRRFAFASGIALLVGISGAVFAGVPLHALVEAFGWRVIMSASAVFPLLAAVGIWLVVRDSPVQRGYQTYVDDEPTAGDRQWQNSIIGLTAIFKYRNTWLLAIVPSGIVGSILAFSGLWGVPFLTTHHGFSKGDAAAVCSTILIAWAIGGPVFGALSDRIGQRKPLYILGCAMVATCWLLLFIFPGMPRVLLVISLITAGFASGCMIIGFAFGKESVPARLAGTVSGVVNMGVMTGPMLQQPFIGLLLDWNWDGRVAEGIKIFGINAYRAGFSLMAGWAVMSFILIFFTRETNCAQAVMETKQPLVVDQEDVSPEPVSSL